MNIFWMVKAFVCRFCHEINQMIRLNVHMAMDGSDDKGLVFIGCTCGRLFWIRPDIAEEIKESDSAKNV